MACKIPSWTKELVFYPMKPAPCLNLPEDVEDWLMEPKYNGWHTVWAIHNRQVAIFSRNLKRDLSDWIGLAAIREKVATISGPITLMGELVYEKAKGLEIAATSIPYLQYSIMPNITVKFFDVVRPGEYDMPLQERRKLLVKTVPYKKWIVEQEWVGCEGYLHKRYKSYVGNFTGNKEGIVLKRPNSLYFPGERATMVTKDWLKIRDIAI
jgi:ATP-dependent DNA ligase